MRSNRTAGRYVLIALMLTALSGCASLGRAVVNRVGDGLSSGGSVFTGDEDPELVLEALPFGLKTYEALLAASPRHRNLLLATASGFAAYGYLLAQQGDLDSRTDYADRRRLDARVSRLYLRARDYALRGLALNDSNFSAQLYADPAAALATVHRADVAFLYWAGIAWAGAISTAKDSPELIAELPLAVALMTRALELDERFDAGAIHEFFVIYEGSRPGGDLDAARVHYERACELDGGKRASAHLALAESVAVRQQDLDEFRVLVQRALAVDPNSVTEWRVANTLALRRAVWLAAHESDLFIDVGEN
jgi:hypothetical protein